jgi:hypothetical protein
MTDIPEGWAVYERRPIYGSLVFRAYLAAFKGWLSAAAKLHPCDAWKLRIEMRLPCMTSEIGRQIMQIAVLQHRHTGEGPPPHPNSGWQLDQDRRCRGEIWPSAEIINYRPESHQ